MTTQKKPRRMARPAPDASSNANDRGSAVGASSTLAAAKRPGKQELVLALLRSEGGVPLGAIVESTGWLPHTARAALTGLRKKGHLIERTKVDSETRYMVAAVAPQ